MNEEKTIERFGISDRRLECLRWKREALEVEARLADHRRLKILEAMEAAEQVEDDDEKVDEGGADESGQQVADEKVRSAFKNLVSRLRQSVLQNELTVRHQRYRKSEVRWSYWLQALSVKWVMVGEYRF